MSRNGILDPNEYPYQKTKSDLMTLVLRCYPVCTMDSSPHTLSELVAQRIVTPRKPSVVQGYYPKHSEFVATLRDECDVHGFDFKEALAEYKDSSLRELFADSDYKRFPTGLNRNVTAEVNQMHSV